MERCRNRNRNKYYKQVKKIANYITAQLNALNDIYQGENIFLNTEPSRD